MILFIFFTTEKRHILILELSDHMLISETKIDKKEEKQQKYVLQVILLFYHFIENISEFTAFIARES